MKTKNATGTDRAAVKRIARFAKKAGVVLVKCSAKEWGGAIGYMDKGSTSRVLGFNTNEEAYRHWLDSTFSSPKLGKAVADLIARHG